MNAGTRSLSGACGLAVAALLVVLAGCGGDPAPDPALVAVLESGDDPAAHLVALFSDHDVVLLGTHGRIARDVNLVVDLVPRLHAAGVRTLAIEYACADDQAAIDSLVTRVVFDQRRAIELQRRYAGGTWPYAEYVDIYKAVWDLNRSLPEGAPRFRLAGISPYVDWRKIHDGSAAEKDAEHAKLTNAEAYMAAAVLRASADLGQKALVLSAIRHAFTRFQPPVLAGDGTVAGRARVMGNHLAERLGERAVTVLSHAPWPGVGPGRLASPCDGALDRALAATTDSVAVSVAGTALGGLTDTRSAFAAGEEKITLGDLCASYLAHGSLATLEGVSVLPAWIPDEETLTRIRPSFPDRRQADGFGSVRDVLDAFQRDAAIGTRFRDAR